MAVTEKNIRMRRKNADGTYTDYFPETKAANVSVEDTSNNFTATDVEGALAELAGSQGVTDHGELSGLSDDDHTQYLTSNRHSLIDHEGIPGVGGGSSAGVSSLNTLTGDVTIAGGGIVSVSKAGQTITVSASSGGGGDLPAIPQDPFAQGTHSGLKFAYGLGIVRADNVVRRVSAGTVTLTDGATNYVEANPDGTVAANTSGYTSGRIPLYKVVASSGAISTVQDDRCFFSATISGGDAVGGFYKVTLMSLLTIVSDFGLASGPIEGE